MSRNYQASARAEEEVSELESYGLYERAKKELALLDEVARILTSTLNTGLEYDRFADALSELVDFDRININVINNVSGFYTVKPLSGLRQPWRQAGDSVPLDHSQTQMVAATNHTLIIEDICETNYPRRLPSDSNLGDLGLRSRIMVPIAVGDNVIAVLSLHSRQPRAFGAEEKRVLERLASLIAPAVHNSLLYEEAKEEMAAVDEVAKIITTTLDIEKVYEEFANALKMVVTFDRVAIRIIDHVAGTSVLKYLHGHSRPEGNVGEVRPWMGTQTQHIVMTGQTLIREDIVAVPGFNADPEFIKLGMLSCIAVPLKYHGGIIGTLTLRSHRRGAYGKSEQGKLERLANLIAPAIYNNLLYEEATKEMAVVDEVARIITTTLDIEQVYDEFVNAMKKLLDFDRIVINTVDLAADTYTLRYISGQPRIERTIHTVTELAGSQNEEVAMTRQTLKRDNFARDPLFPSDQETAKLGLRASIMVPLISRGQIIGTLGLRSRNIAAYGQREQAVLERLADQIAPAIDNSMSYEKVLISEQKYQSLMNQSPDLLFVSRIDDLRFTEVNDRACEHYGYSREEFMSLSILDVEVEQATHREVRALYNKIPIGRLIEVYGTNKRKDGSTFPVQVRFTKLNETYAVANVRDITQQKVAEDEKRRQAKQSEQAKIERAANLARTRELEVSRQRVSAAGESVRKELARQLHGSVQNKLIVLVHQLHQLKLDASSDEVIQQLDSIENGLRTVIEKDVRQVSHQLYPTILSNGLVPGLQSLIEGMDPSLSVDLNLDQNLVQSEKEDNRLIPESIRLAAYRIIEEAITNVVKHAKARQLQIGVGYTADQSLQVSVSDDGQGFDMKKVQPGFGTLSIKDQAEISGGSCLIHSEPEKGTKITATFPLPKSLAKC